MPPRWILTVAAVLLFFWLVAQLKEVVVLLVVGYALAYAIDPILDILEKRKISRSIGLFIILSVLIILASILIVTALPVIIDEFGKLVSNLPHYIEVSKGKILTIFENFRSKLSPELLLKLGLDNIDGSNLPIITKENVDKILSGLGSALLGGYSITLTLLNIALLPFIVFYLAIDIDKMHGLVLKLFSKSYRKSAERFFHEIDGYLSAFLRGQIIVGTILFMLYAFGLGIIGVDLWFLLAVISGFGNFIPYVGFISGIVLSTIMTLVTFQDLSHLYMVWGLYAIVQFLEGTFITPKIVGNKVGLSPLVVILAIFSGGKLFGLLGILLAVPGAAALRVVGKRIHGWVLSEL